MYRIYRNDNGQLARLVYQVSGHDSLEFDNFLAAANHANRLMSDKTQYVVLNEDTKLIEYVTFFTNELY